MKKLEKDIKAYLKARNWHNLRPSDIAKSISIEAAELLELFQWQSLDIKGTKKDKEKFRKALQSTINIHERLIPKIVELINESKPQFLMIKGVGSVYPFIRSHTVLNNLQSAVKDIPTLMFFPGEYSGQSLNLFGLLKDDNYYRAFNIDNFKL